MIGCEYACIFAALGAKVTVIDRRTELLRFIDPDSLEVLQSGMRREGIRLILGEPVNQISQQVDGRATRVTVELESGRVVRADRLLVAAGRDSNTAALDLDKIGVPTDETGLIKVDPSYRTSVDHVYAVGDVIGFPALASTSMHQGRMAVLHAKGHEIPATRDLPIAIYTIPEISSIGLPEQDCQAQNIPYEIGVARYGETPRGQIIGEQTGC